jgi:hypothetical protein
VWCNYLLLTLVYAIGALAGRLSPTALAASPLISLERIRRSSSDRAVAFGNRVSGVVARISAA